MNGEVVDLRAATDLRGVTFNLATGKLGYRNPDIASTTDRVTALDMNKVGNLGFFGGTLYSTAEEAKRNGHTSEEFFTAVERHRADKPSLSEYYIYKIQSLQSLGERSDRVCVPIWIAHGRRSSELRNVAPAWIEHLKQAINDINDAAPGLFLYTTNEKSKAKVLICGTDKNKCSTFSNILDRHSSRVKVRLSDTWHEMRRTSCHELLHALAFGHEHQRRDRDGSIDVKSEGAQYCKKDELFGLTRFDPFSIMLYPEDERLSRNSGDPVWFTKPDRELNRKMSELDKVSLNNLYRPCRGPSYSPFRGITGLWYCGRYFGVQRSEHNGYCGPTNGPNCPACRVLKTDRVVSLWEKDKWQGWTGEVYCGRYFGVQHSRHDGYCGPGNGPSCPECNDELAFSNHCVNLHILSPLW